MQTKTVKAPITKAASNGSGKFEAIIHAFERDLDGERFESFVNVPGRFPLNYQHLNFVPGEAEGTIEDPGARIGTVRVTHDKTANVLRLEGQLDLLSNPSAQGVYERMLMAPSQRLALNEFSVGFEVDRRKSWTETDGTVVLVDARLVEVSVVWRGAQRTELLAVKAQRERVFPHRDENGEKFLISPSGGWCIYEDGKVLKVPAPAGAAAKTRPRLSDRQIDRELNRLDPEIATQVNLLELEAHVERVERGWRAYSEEMARTMPGRQPLVLNLNMTPVATTEPGTTTEPVQEGEVIRVPVYTVESADEHHLVRRDRPGDGESFRLNVLDLRREGGEDETIQI